MDIEAKTIQRIVRDAAKLESDLKLLEPAARTRVLGRYMEETNKMVDRLKEAK